MVEKEYPLGRARKTGAGVMCGILGALLMSACTPMQQPAALTAVPQSKTLHAVLDTFTSTQEPGTGHGTKLAAYASQTVNQAFLRFDSKAAVPAGMKLASAKVRVYTTAVATTKSGAQLHPTTVSWSETALTESNRPAYDSRVVSGTVTPKVNSWTELPVTD